MTFEEDYLGVLQNIEFGIMTAYRKYPDLSDYDVMRALEPLIQRYRAEKTGHEIKKCSLDEKEQLVFDLMQEACELNLGRMPIFAMFKKPPDVRTIDEIIACLKRVLKSVNRFNRLNGPQGYLKYVSNFIK